MNEVYMKKDGEFKPLMLAIGDGADFVVEQGTSGIWSYRKWNSGIAECWGIKTFDTVTFGSWGALYSSSENVGSIPYPFSFATTPTVNINCLDSNRWVTIGAGTKTVTPSTYIIGVDRTVMGNKQYSIHAIGTWK